MGLVGTLRLLALLALVALLVGVGVAAFAPGGPLDFAALQGQVEDLGGGGTANQTGPATETPPPGTQGASPWGHEVLVVAVRNAAAPDRNVSEPVAEAITYWNGHGGYADYPVTFRLESDAEAPDVVVWYNDSIECPAHDDAIGCAPVLDASARVDGPLSVQIRYDPTDNRRQVRNTVIHELGHVLGRTHCEAPHWVMASACEEDLPPVQDAAERDLAWRDHTITVYVDDSNVSDADLAETREQVGHAFAYVAQESPGNVSLVRVDDRFEADVSVVFEAESACGGESVVCFEHQGRDVDGDGRMEYYTAGLVRVEPGSDVAARGWYVGWGMANQLSPGNVPRVFEDASYRERRSRWWE